MIDDEKLKIIDEMMNNIMKVDIDKVEFFKLFFECLICDKMLKVVVNLFYRLGVSKENNVNFIYLIVSKFYNKDFILYDNIFCFR